MPQNKRTDSAELDVTELPDLVPQHMEFVRLIAIEGLGASEAYRRAIAGPETKDTTIWAKASHLYHSDKIRAWLDAANDTKLEKIIEDREEHVRRMRGLARRAERAGNYGAAVNAEKAVGQVLGHYIERHEDITKGPDIRDMQTSDIVGLLQVLQHELSQRQAQSLNDAVGEHIGSTQQ